MFVTVVLLAVMAVAAAFAQPKLTEKAERGRYLVQDIGQCHTCHTPKLETGEYDREKWLKGSLLNIQPIEEIKGWHKTAPDITPGSRLWSKWGEQALLKYLQTGIAPSGRPAEPPMPAYKFNAADAEAVVEYLKTLK
jgi:mono/diheme cytochrome c family protein